MRTKTHVSRVKITLGYALMLAVLLFSLFFVNREMGNLTLSEDRNMQWEDSLMTLLREKDENTIRLLRMMSAASDSLISTNDIEQMIAQHDTIIIRQRVQQHVVKRRDTIRTPKKEKKGFFKRLGEVFVPPKEDTTVQIRTSTEVAMDTLYDTYNPVDSLQERLKAVTQKRQEQQVTVQRRQRYLRGLDKMLNARIDSLLKGYEQEVLLRAREADERQERVRQRSARIIGGIAVGAVLLSAFFLMLIGRDVTRSNRYRRELEEARRRAEDLLATREKLMLAITHDFKAPLGSIIGYIDLLSRLTTKKREEIYLNNMRESSAHLLALVNDLLVYYKLDNHKAEVNAVTFCPARLFDTVCREFRLTAEAKGLTITAETTEAASKLYTGDPFRIRQIADNLVSNAVKFTDKGGITLKADVADGTLVFSVRDTGRGMTDEEKRRVFGEFVRLGSARGAEGFGLGLSIVDRIVDLLGGSISVESRKGEGSEFRVSIPVKEAGEDDESAAGTADETPELKLKCLIVDDDTIQLELTRAMCERFGLEAECCQYPEYAVRLAAEGNFDLLMTDIQMPEMDGFRLLELVREQENGRNITAIALSARSDDREEYLKRGFAAVLRKPFTSSELAEVLRSVKIAAATPDKTETPASGLSALTSFATDDPEAAEAILRSFVEQNRLHVSKLSKAAADGDIDTIAALAHKMLPIFTMIGCNEMEETLKRLERRETADPETLRREVSDLVEKVESIIANAEKEISLSGKESKDAPDSDR